MTTHRPLLLSVMQFEDELKSGARTVFAVIDTAHRLGLDGVELRRELWPNWRNELAQARQRIEELGLIVTYATFATLFAGGESTPADHTAVLRQDIDAAAALGAPQLRVFPGPVPSSEDEASWARARAVVAYAAEQGIVLALENFARTPGGTLAEIEAVLAQIPDPALKSNIDIGNYLLHGQDVPAAIDALAARAVSAHLKDQPTDLAQPPTYLGGSGRDLTPVFAAFERLPQRIIYCFEFGGGGDPEEGIRRSMAYLQALR
ncbi:MAG TPA: TIM barrel protein [Caldilineaceae bacterium]|nr:TIM barrel protein [Caldilineaceae bacterium]